MRRAVWCGDSPDAPLPMEGDAIPISPQPEQEETDGSQPQLPGDVCASHVPTRVTVLLLGAAGLAETTLGLKVSRRLNGTFVDLNEASSADPTEEDNRPPENTCSDARQCFQDETLQGVLNDTNWKGSWRVVACRGDILDSAVGRQTAISHRPVVFVDRHVDDEGCRLESRGGVSHDEGDPPDRNNRHERDLPFYQTCADIWFPIASFDDDVDASATMLARLLWQGFYGQSVHLGPDTFAVQVDFPSCRSVPSPKLQAALSGADIIELRVDALVPSGKIAIAQEVAHLRRLNNAAVLMYTVRSSTQGGTFDGTEDQYIELVKFGCQLGAELIDVECVISDTALEQIVTHKSASLLVGSFHELSSPMPASEEQVSAVFQRCLLVGNASAVRVGVLGQVRANSWVMQEIGEASVQIPFSAMCLAGAGVQLSQLLNRCLCPVSLPLERCPPTTPSRLLPVQELIKCRGSLRTLTRACRQFIFFGPWGSESIRVLAEVCDKALQELGSPHRCYMRQVRESHDACIPEMVSLTSVGGVFFADLPSDTCLGFADDFDTSLTEASGTVDCLLRRETGSVTGHSVGRKALCKTIMDLARVKNANNSKLVGVVLGCGLSASVAIAAMIDIGFRRIICGGCEEGPNFTYLVTLDRTNSPERLGINVSHENRGPICVEAVSGGLVGKWNEEAMRTEPRVRVCPGDAIVEVNGVRGCSTYLLGELRTPQLLEIRFSRMLLHPSVEVISDMTVLASLCSLDVMIMAEPPPGGYARLEGASWLQPSIGRLKPDVIQSLWPAPLEAADVPGSGMKGSLRDFARISECAIVESAELLYERACVAVTQILGGSESDSDVDGLRRAVARAFVPSMGPNVVPNSIQCAAKDVT